MTKDIISDLLAIQWNYKGVVKKKLLLLPSLLFFCTSILISGTKVNPISKDDQIYSNVFIDRNDDDFVFFLCRIRNNKMDLFKVYNVNSGPIKHFSTINNYSSENLVQLHYSAGQILFWSNPKDIPSNQSAIKFGKNKKIIYQGAVCGFQPSIDNKNVVIITESSTESGTISIVSTSNSKLIKKYTFNSNISILKMSSTKIALMYTPSQLTCNTIKIVDTADDSIRDISIPELLVNESKIEIDDDFTHLFFIELNNNDKQTAVLKLLNLETNESRVIAHIEEGSSYYIRDKKTIGIINNQMELKIIKFNP